MRKPERPSSSTDCEAAAPKLRIHIRSTGCAFGADGCDYVRREFGSKLGKFTSSIERISFRVEDVNRPRGDVDQSCGIKVALRGLSSVDLTLSGVKSAVESATQRRRMKPLRRAP
jgi:hypothetical protein